jgi:hypothetical protein
MCFWLFSDSIAFTTASPINPRWDSVNSHRFHERDHGFQKSLRSFHRDGSHLSKDGYVTSIADRAAIRMFSLQTVLLLLARSPCVRLGSSKRFMVTLAFLDEIRLSDVSRVHCSRKKRPREADGRFENRSSSPMRDNQKSEVVVLSTT